jgi:hypothetical protein
MGWFSRIFKGDGAGAGSPEDVVRFYQQLGFFAGADPAAVLRQYTEEHREPPDPGKSWDDVFVLACSEGDVWADDPEADVCAENAVYSRVLPEWACISQGVFSPSGITEQWQGDSGPITLRFQLEGRPASVSPLYHDDWIDLEVLRQVNTLITSSGRHSVAPAGLDDMVMAL